MASIERGGDRYKVRWRDPDGTERARRVPDFTTAKRLKRDVEREVGEGRRWKPRDTRKAPDLEEVLTAFGLYCERVKAASTALVYARYLLVFLRWLRAREGARTRLHPELLTKQTLEEFWQYLTTSTGRNGEKRATITAIKYIERVQDAWQWAFNSDEYGDFVPKPRELELPTVEYKPVLAPTWAEMDAAIESAKGWYRRLMLVQRFTGLRVNQVMRLMWSDVDIERRLIVFRGALGKTKQEKRGRVIPISRHLADELATWGKREGWLIDSKRKEGSPRERQARGREVARAWKIAGVRHEVWLHRPDHAFRKGFVSELKRAGGDADAVEFLVGHSLGRMRDEYTDPDSLALRDAVDRVPAFGQHTHVVSLGSVRSA